MLTTKQEIEIIMRAMGYEAIPGTNGGWRSKKDSSNTKYNWEANEMTQNLNVLVAVLFAEGLAITLYPAPVADVLYFNRNRPARKTRRKNKCQKQS